jgi:hypothetical protein
MRNGCAGQEGQGSRLEGKHLENEGVAIYESGLASFVIPATKLVLAGTPLLSLAAGFPARTGGKRFPLSFHDSDSQGNGHVVGSSRYPD